MTEAVVCNLCGSDDTELLYRRADERLRIDDLEWPVVRCRVCGLGYLNPRPTRTAIARYYPDSYFTARAGMLERYRRQAEYVPAGGRRLLDIGAARGDFLAVMRERGWDVVGIEPAAAGNPHGLTIHRIPFPVGCELPAESFDVITAWAVFEHLHDPAAAFRTCAKLLRPGGQLVLQVPNLRSPAARWPLQEDVPRHLYFFSGKTLNRYAAGAGLELGRIVHTTNLFGGSGRGIFRLALARASGRSTREFFEIWRAPRRERFRRWPAFTFAWTTTAAVERVLLADWIIRAARISGQIVAYISKPVARESLEDRLITEERAA